MKKGEQIPKGALRFVDEGTDACAFAEREGDETPRLNMLAYSGKVIKGHWFWGDMVMDLEGMKMAAPKIPVLEQHDKSKKIGFTQKLVKDERGLSVDPAKTKFLNTDVAKEFIANSEDGFPFQSSVYAVPEKIQRLAEKEEVEVNGFTFKGPGTIFAKTAIKEVSVCVFGWDSQTSSSAFAKDVMEDVEYDLIERGDAEEDELELQQPLNGGEVTTEMDLQTLKTEHKDLVEALKAEFLSEAEAEKSVLQEQVTQLSDRVDKLSTKLDLKDKDLTLIRVQANSEKAERMFENAFNESSIPDRFHEKIMRLVPHTKFVDADENFDSAKFSEALTEEIDSWVKGGVTTEVLGLSTTLEKNGGEEEDATQLAEENKDLTDDLLSRVSQA